LYDLCAGFGRPLDFYQVRVTAVTEATGNCTLEASPPLQINNTTSTVHKLFIYSEAKYYNIGVQPNDVCLRSIQNAKFLKTAILRERCFILQEEFESTASLPDKNSLPIG
jgi:hypothetical protein